ncbi:MAG: transposase [Synechococcales cyanobacterium RU_4_20]|nr:transposase [Synechococcales cyanobacterium RU_4_20]NJR67533.1 transposase [Synechococcales cyanobacterium CRU_2_2]
MIKAVEEGGSIRTVAKRFGVGKNFVQKLSTRKRTLGHIEAFPQGGGESPAMAHQEKIKEIVERQPDATLLEYSEMLRSETGDWVSPSAMCRTLGKLELTRKKKRCVPAKPKASGCSSSGSSIGSR